MRDENFLIWGRRGQEGLTRQKRVIKGIWKGRFGLAHSYYSWLGKGLLGIF